MRLFIIVLAFLISTEAMADPMAQLEWQDQSRTSLIMRIKGPDKELNSCMESGAEMQYRLEIKRCRQYRLLWRECTREVVETHHLKYDGINETYNLRRDRFRDGAEPYTEIFRNRAAAVRAMRVVKDLPISLLAFNQESQLAPDEFILARTFSECSARSNKTLSRLSTFFTLGMIKLNGFDTGWRQYNLE